MVVIENGYGYSLKLRPEDLSDPSIPLFRGWLIAQSVGCQTGAIGDDLT